MGEVVIGENPEAVWHITPKARIKHTCVECQGVIAKGEIYHQSSGIWAGEYRRYRVCCDCHGLREVLDEDADPSETTCFGYLYETVLETDGVDYLKRFLRICDARHSQAGFIKSVRRTLEARQDLRPSTITTTAPGHRALRKGR